MRVAIIRQRYAPTGGAERFFEGALEALLERNVAISLYTRSWPQTKLQLIEPVICDPWYAGSLWREWGFARSVCRAIGRSKANLVESHERLLCCDIYRARDGVHAVWLEERLKGASAYDRLRLAASPFNRYMLRVEKRLFASPWLQAVICNSKMVRDEIRDRFGLPESKLPVVYNAVDSDIFNPKLRAGRAALLQRYGIDPTATVFLLAGSGYEHSGAGDAIEALAELPALNAPPDRRPQPSCAALPPARAIARRRGPRHDGRPGNGSQGVLRRRRCVRAARTLRPGAGSDPRSDGLRPARDHEHEIGRGGAPAAPPGRVRVSGRRRRGTRRADAHAARPGHAQPPRRQCARRGAAPVAGRDHPATRSAVSRSARGDRAFQDRGRWHGQGFPRRGSAEADRVRLIEAAAAGPQAPADEAGSQERAADSGIEDSVGAPACAAAPTPVPPAADTPPPETPAH